MSPVNDFTVDDSFDMVSETRGFRGELDNTLQFLKDSPRKSRERSLSITKIQEAIMWLGMDLKAQRDKGIHNEPSPYPDSKNPDSKAQIAPAADGLKL